MTEKKRFQDIFLSACALWLALRSKHSAGSKQATTKHCESRPLKCQTSINYAFNELIYCEFVTVTLQLRRQQRSEVKDAIENSLIATSININQATSMQFRLDSPFSVKLSAADNQQSQKPMPGNKINR